MSMFTQKTMLPEESEGKLYLSDGNFILMYSYKLYTSYWTLNGLEELLLP
jgi:hypothetical protein